MKILSKIFNSWKHEFCVPKTSLINFRETFETDKKDMVISSMLTLIKVILRERVKRLNWWKLTSDGFGWWLFRPFFRGELYTQMGFFVSGIIRKPVQRKIWIQNQKDFFNFLFL